MHGSQRKQERFISGPIGPAMFKRLWPVFVLISFLATPAWAAEPPAFGLREKYGRDIGVFYKWTDALARMDADWNVPRVFIQHPELAGLDFIHQVFAVNNIVNGYPDVSDDDNWGKSDYWETPNEFFVRGGDCEDYAIAKYAWLRYLGVPDSRLRIAMVYDRLKQAEHMILVAYTESGQPLYLDSQLKDARTRNDFARYWPLYSINREGWWIVQPEGKGREIVQSLLADAASSAR